MKKLSVFFVLLLWANCSLGQSQNLDRFIDSFATQNNFNGTILIQKQSKIIYHNSYGLANFEFEVPNKVNVKYKIASLTKLFTSVLIMQLVEQERVDLNSSLKTYLSTYPGESGDKITIHQLLNHTSGIANMDTVTSMESALKSGVPLYQIPRSSDQLLKEVCSGKLVNKPGKVFDYNNADYIVLGKIIEKVYDKTYEQTLIEYILKPLKMKNTGLVHQNIIVEGLTDTYFFRDDLNRLMPDLPVYMENYYAAGAMYSTTNDILQFSNGLFGLKLLNQESLNQMFFSGLGEYGYGVWVYEDYEIDNKMYKVIKRPGLIMGAQAMLFHILGADSTIIILSNTGTTNLDHFAAELAKQIIS